jgi:hypothetical protein
MKPDLFAVPHLSRAWVRAMTRLQANFPQRLSAVIPET